MSSQEKVKQSIEATAGNTAAGNFILISMVVGFASGFEHLVDGSATFLCWFNYSNESISR